MITLRKADERGRANFGWLDSHHTFSFGDYFDSKHMGFSHLRVINDDRVTAGAGFPTHPHRDMEIITYVLEGAIEHKDSMGTGAIVHAGDVQRMSAGTGVTHSEFNHSKTDPLHFLQIWIMPGERGTKPGYEQKSFGQADKLGKLRLVAARDGRDGAITVRQDVDLYATVLEKGSAVEHRLRKGRQAWVQVARGSVKLGDHALGEGDGAAISTEESIRLEGTSATAAEVLLFDLP